MDERGGDRFFYREGIAIDVFAESLTVNVLRVVIESVDDGNILVIEGRQRLRFALETPEEAGYFEGSQMCARLYQSVPNSF